MLNIENIIVSVVDANVRITSVRFDEKISKHSLAGRVFRPAGPIPHKTQSHTQPGAGRDFLDRAASNVYKGF